MSLDSPSEAWAALSTATVSDALDRAGLRGSAAGVGALAPGQRAVGRAFTVRYVPAGTPAGTVGDYIDDVPDGQIVVLDNDGRTDCTVWGDILTSVAHRRGIAATAINGVGRDTARALELAFPIWSVGRFMRTGKDRVEVAEIGGVVALGDVQVRAGDVVLGDDDGVVVVPRDHEAQVLRTAREIADREGAILAEALDGGSLREARRRHGYHELQRQGAAER